MIHADNPKAFLLWRLRVERRLPQLAQLVFNLRLVPHRGRAYDWKLEFHLSEVIKLITNYQTSYPSGTDREFVQLHTELLFKAVSRVKKELKL